jgi:hypothetical protein
MLRSKLLGMATAAMLLGSLGAAPAAMAAPQAAAAGTSMVAAAKPAPTTQPVTGTLAGESFTGAISDLTVRTVGDSLQLAGTITGTGLPTDGTPFTAEIQQIVIPEGCEILDLVLGPLQLDVLGLVISLDTVHLNITAVPGAGNLLGNLLCAIAGLLDNDDTPLNLIARLLNRLLTALGL